MIFQWTFVHFFSTITKPTSSSTSSTQATVSESAQSDTKTVAGSAPTTPAQQQDSGVPESSKEMMLNPEYHSNIDENGYNSLLGAYVLDNNNGGNNSNTTTESSAIGSSE
ncbi:cytosolic protein [Streptococcus salivarius]|nr:cytosolic protein [Streptococcus salivarius]